MQPSFLLLLLLRLLRFLLLLVASWLLVSCFLPLVACNCFLLLVSCFLLLALAACNDFLALAAGNFSSDALPLLQAGSADYCCGFHIRYVGFGLYSERPDATWAIYEI